VCEPNYAYAVKRTPDDLFLRSQYTHRIIKTEAAWETSTGRDDLLALVVDTGIDYTHPDLIDNVWRNPGEIPGNGLDDDRNGVIDDLHGFNAIRNSGDPFDDHGHGTHVAGILGARGNNGVGIAGVAWNVKLVGLKFLGRNGMGSLADAVRAIEYGTALRRAGHKVVVSNNSWSSLSRSAALQSAIERAGDAGILFVAAAGNSRSDTATRPFYPASYPLPNVVAVASVDNRGNLSGFSNYGPRTVHIAAPGSGIVSTYPGARYVSMNGTSMAAPAVAGVALLVQAVCSRYLSPREVKDRLLNTAAPTQALWGRIVTAGVVDAARAVAELAPLCSAPPAMTPTASPTATPPVTATPTPSPIPSPSPTPLPTPPPSPTPSPSPIPTPRFVAASFTATVTTARGGVPGAEVVWRVANSARIILTQRTNYLGRIGTTVSGDDFSRLVLPYVGARINVTVTVPPGYRGSGDVGETIVLGAQNSVSFRAEAPTPPR
jgi:subtilisin family serine protease